MAPQPTCAEHPDRVADRVCARCGTFVCSGCLVSEDICSNCKSLLFREGIPYSPMEKARATARRCMRLATRLVQVLFLLGVGVVVLLFSLGGGAHAHLARAVAEVLAGLGVLLGLVVAILAAVALLRSHAGRPGPEVAGVVPPLPAVLLATIGVTPGVLAVVLILGS